jgi:catechol 2,3-dioxygenase-like lactoylglutathione lyase family enzyme
MSTNVVRSFGTGVAKADMKFEAVVIPVSDVDRAKEFYGKLGWRLDADFRFENGFRVVQFTRPGSPCSVQFGTNITRAVPGSAQGLYLVVSDIKTVRAELVARTVEVSDVFHAGTPGAQFQPDGTRVRVRGPSPDHAGNLICQDLGWIEVKYPSLHGHETISPCLLRGGPRSACK